MGSEYIVVREGLIKLKIANPSKFLRPDGIYEPSWAPVFYNPRQILNRDLSVVVLNAMNISENSIILDALSGTGVRALRYAAECKVSEAIANDIDSRAYRLIIENIVINELEDRVRAYKLDANALMYFFKSLGRVFDFIDIDPYGSPAPFVRSSLWSVKNNGAIGYTATDTAPLYGVKWLSGSRKYDVKLIKTDIPQEVGVRVLLGYIARRAAELERSVNPLISFVNSYYVRVFVRVRRGARRACEMLDSCIGYMLYCANCFYKLITKDIHNVSLKCPLCGSELDYLGPIWICRLCDDEFLFNLRSELLKGKYDYLSNLSKIDKLVSMLIIENKLLNLYNVVSPAKVLKVNVPPTESVVECLRSKGFNATRSYIKGQYIRTNAPWEEFLKCITD